MSSRARHVLLYGATGYTGRLVIDALLARGVEPILAGRRADTIARLADARGLAWRAFPLEDSRRVAASLDEVAVVLNAAGPFSATAAPLVNACLARGAHYLDLSGEVEVLAAIAERNAEALAAGVMLLPAVGFDVVPSDALAAHLARRMPDARRLTIAITGLDLVSRGSARSTVAMMSQPLRIRREGRVIERPQLSMERVFDFGEGRSINTTALSWGDVITAHHTTGIPDITTYVDANAALWMHNAMVRTFGESATRAFGQLLLRAGWQRSLAAAVELLPEGPSPEERARHHAVIVAEVEDARGRILRARLRTPEVYSVTATLAAAIVARVLDGIAVPGFQTPARVLGADFVLTIPGVTRVDL